MPWCPRPGRLLLPYPVTVNDPVTGAESPANGYRFESEPNHWYWPDLPAGSLLAHCAGVASVHCEYHGRHGVGRWIVAPPDGRSVELPHCVVGDLFAEDRIRVDPDYREARRLIELSAASAFVEMDLPSARLQRGDVLVHQPDRDEPARVKGSTHRLRIDDFEHVSQVLALTEGELLTELTPAQSHFDGVATFLNDRRQWGLRLSSWYSRLWRVRPYGSGPFEIILAGNDRAAVQELVWQSGGR